MGCYATGAVTGKDFCVGGLVGYNTGGTVTACYATGAVTDNITVGGLVGENRDTVAASFWDVETSRQAGSPGGKGLTTAQMKTLTIFRNAGWGAYNWVMADGQYPRLAWEGTGADPVPAPESVPLAGSGTEADPYQVGAAAEFALLSWHVALLDKHILLIADLDCAGVTLFPIGDLGPFTGVFHGGGHVVRNTTIEQPDSDVVGVFCRLGSGGEIHNFGMENVVINGRAFVGGLVGWNNYGTVTGCYATGTVTGVGYYGSYVGALVGWNYGTVKDCHATGAVTGYNAVGGLVGANSNSGTVTGCYATGAVTGAVTGQGYIGGLAGWNYGTVTGSYATGAVTGRDYVGGLVGWNWNSGTLRNCYATGAVAGNDSVGGLVGGNGGTVTCCYATGAVSGNTNLGGLVGFLESGTVTGALWDMTVGGPDNGIGTGLPTAQMKQRATFESAGWDFTGPPPVWFIFEALSYPYLFGLPIPVGSIGDSSSGTLITASAPQGKSADAKNCSVDILATDSHGNRVGSLYSGSVFTEDVNEIPNARYGGHGAFPNYIYVPWPIEVSALEFIPLCDGPFVYTMDIWTPVGSFYHHEEQLTASAGEHVSVSVPEYPVLPVVSKIALVFFVVLMVGIGVRQTRHGTRPARPSSSPPRC